MALDGIRAPIRSQPFSVRGSQYGGRIGSSEASEIGWSAEWQRYYTQLDMLVEKWSRPAIGTGSQANDTKATAVGKNSKAGGAFGSTAIGYNANAVSTFGGNTAIGVDTNVTGTVAIGIGIGVEVTGAGGISIGGVTGGDYAIGLGISTGANHNYTLIVGRNAESSQTNEAVLGSALSYFRNWQTVVQANGQAFAIRSLTELTTILAAATTDTAIQIPAGAILLSANVRVTAVIPTAATFTVTGAGSGTTFHTTAVQTTLNYTDDGTAAGAFYNGTAQSIRITPNLTPADNTGRVRVTLIYFEAVPATS